MTINPELQTITQIRFPDQLTTKLIWSPSSRYKIRHRQSYRSFCKKGHSSLSLSILVVFKQFYRILTLDAFRYQNKKTQHCSISKFSTIFRYTDESFNCLSVNVFYSNFCIYGLPNNSLKVLSSTGAWTIRDEQFNVLVWPIRCMRVGLGLRCAFSRPKNQLQCGGSKAVWSFAGERWRRKVRLRRRGQLQPGTNTIKLFCRNRCCRRIVIFWLRF